MSKQSGHVGVTWHKAHQRWMASLRYQGKLFHAGYFDSIDKAVAARKEAAIKLENGEELPRMRKKHPGISAAILKKYIAAKSHAKLKSLSFTLSLDQWLGVWAGHFAEGNQRLCMSRIDKEKGFEVGNVEIVPGPAPRSKEPQYHHGTLHAYINGKCRCELCRAANSKYQLQRQIMKKQNNNLLMTTT